MLAVSDIGGGVAADRIWHVFGSFFTTKEVGKGILSYPPDEGLVCPRIRHRTDHIRFHSLHVVLVFIMGFGDVWFWETSVR